MRLIFPSFIDCCFIIATINRRLDKKISLRLISLSLIISLPIDYISNQYSNVLFIETLIFILLLPFLLYKLGSYSIENLWPVVSLILEIAIFNMVGMIIGNFIIYSNTRQMDVFVFAFFLITRLIIFRRLRATNRYQVDLSKFQDRKIILKLMGFLLGTIILCFILINYFYWINGNMIINEKAIIMLVLVVGIFAYLYVIIQQVMKHLDILYEERLLKNYYKINREYLQLIHSKTRQMKMISHNLKDHLVMIKHFAKTDNKKLLQYLDDMDNLEDVSDIVWVPQMEFISPVIQNKIELAVSIGISIDLDNRLKSEVFDNWDMIDIVLIVSNLLDNAIEAISNYEAKYKNIKFIIGEQMDYIYFKSINYYDFSYNVSNTNSRVGGKNLDKGNGLKIIDLIVNKHFGWWNYKIIEDKIIFLVALSKTEVE